MDQLPRIPDDILFALRAATSDAHQQLEDAVQIERRVTNPASYRRLLEIFLGFYRPLEETLFALRGWKENGLAVTDRHKTQWLEDDLRALGMSGPEISVLPDCNRLPSTVSSARAFGCLYVLEGATLGGRQITAMMRESPVPPTARRFFASYGAETGARWREFIAALESYAKTAGEVGRVEIVDAARETFACLQAWFVRECPVHEQPG